MRTICDGCGTTLYYPNPLSAEPDYYDERHFCEHRSCDAVFCADCIAGHKHCDNCGRVTAGRCDCEHD